MNLRRPLLILGTYFVCLCGFGQAADETAPPAAPLILVAPFENLSGTIIDIAPDDTVHAPKPDLEVVISNQPRPTEHKVIADRLVDAPRAVLENLIVNLPAGTGRAMVVERSRADGLFSEGITPEQARDPKTAIRLAQATGATAIALGTITQLTSSGERMLAEVRVRLVGADGTVRYSQMLHGESSTGANRDAAYSAIQAALQNLEHDADFRAQIIPESGAEVNAESTIEVLVQPSESRCELEIDGVFVGTTPGRFAFPSSRKVRVRISKAGFEPWDRTVIATKDLRLTPELATARR
jgi:hypothetical protein